MVERHLSEDEGRQVLQKLQDVGYDTPSFWWEISTLKVDWAYALALSHPVGQPAEGGGGDGGAGGKSVSV